MSTGTIVDATIIAAPSLVAGTRDPEMHQTKKGQEWYFGMKRHFGVDSRSKHLHPVHRMPAERPLLRLTSETAAEFGNLNLETDWGQLDCLGEILGVGGYDEVLARRVEVELPPAVPAEFWPELIREKGSDSQAAESERRVEETVMGHHAKKLVERRPEKRIGRRAFAESREQRQRLLVMCGAAAVGVDENVRVERDHALSALHQLEQLVAIREVDTGQ